MAVLCAAPGCKASKGPFFPHSQSPLPKTSCGPCPELGRERLQLPTMPTWRQACRIIVALVGSEQHHLLLLIIPATSPHLTVTSPNPPFKAHLHAPVIFTTVQRPGLYFLFGVRVVSYKLVRPRIATSVSQPRTTTASLTLAFGFL